MQQVSVFSMTVDPRVSEELNHHWRRFVILGAALIVLGILALGSVGIATIASVLVRVDSRRRRHPRDDPRVARPRVERIHAPSAQRGAVVCRRRVDRCEPRCGNALADAPHGSVLHRRRSSPHRYCTLIPIRGARLGGRQRRRDNRARHDHRGRVARVGRLGDRNVRRDRPRLRWLVARHGRARRTRSRL